MLLCTHTHPAMIFIKIVLTWFYKRRKYFRVYGKVILEVKKAGLERIPHLSCFLSCLIKKKKRESDLMNGTLLEVRKHSCFSLYFSFVT